MPLSPDKTGELRSMVRDVLREVMAARTAANGNAASAVEPVRIASDADLAAFVQRLIEPATLDAVRAGKLRFSLSGAAVPRLQPPPPGQVFDGVITEQKIGKAASGGTLVLAPGAVLTPLAQDKARRLGLKIERRR